MSLFRTKKEKPVFEGQIVAQTNKDGYYIVKASDSGDIYICRNDSKRTPNLKDIVYFEKDTVDKDAFFEAGVIRTSYDAKDLQFAENKDLAECSKSDVLKKWYKNLPLSEEAFNTREERNTTIFTSLSTEGSKELHTIMTSAGIL